MPTKAQKKRHNAQQYEINSCFPSKEAKIAKLIVNRSNPDSCPNRYKTIKKVCEGMDQSRKNNGLEELNFND